MATSVLAAQSGLERGIELYWSGQYQETVLALTLVRESTLRQDEKVECLKYLAFSHVAMANDREAQSVFTELLESDPRFELDASQLSPKILRQFERSRDQLVQELFRDGKDFYTAGKYDESHQVMSRILELDPDFVLAVEYQELAAQQVALIEKEAVLDSQPPPPVRAPPTPEPADRVYHLTSEVQRPVLTSRVSPQYPAAARRARRQGTVVITMIVGADGHVRSAKTVRTVSPALDRAALNAVRKWRYRPAMLAGRPVAVHVVVQMAFELNSK